MLNWLFKATLFISAFPVQTAVAQEILRTEMVLNPADSHEIQNAFDIGFLFYMKNGDTLMTKGFLNGTVGWNELDVSSSRMLIYHGWCSFSRFQLQLFNYNVDITVRSKRHGLLLQDTFVIPHVQRLEITNETPTVFPGEDLRLNIKTRFSNGSVYSVLDDNLFNFSDFKYYLDSTQIDPSQFYVPYRVDSPQFLNLKVEFRLDKNVVAYLKLPIAYDQVWRLDFSGMPGADGENGVDGKIDLDDGALRHGTDGQHGQNGQDGSNINIVFKVTPAGGDTFLETLIVTDTNFRYMKLKAGYNLLSLNLNGGHAGHGGNGGKGAPELFEKHLHVFNGTGGNGGNGGLGGDGGESFLFTDSLGQFFVSHFQVLNNGGRGGRAGFYGAAGDTIAKKDSRKDRFLKGLYNTVIGEIPGIDGLMGEQGRTGASGPPPIMQLIATHELEAIIEQHKP